MPNSNRFSRIFLLSSYGLLSALPFFPYLQRQSVDQAGTILASGLLGWTMLWAVFKGPRWFHCLLLPAMLMMPVEIYLRLYYGQGISTHHLGIMLETSPKEAAEFLGNKVWLLAALSILIVAWWWQLQRFVWRTDVLAWRHPSRWLALCGTLVISVVSSYAYWVGVQAQTSSGNSGSASTRAAISGKAISVSALEAGRQRLVQGPGPAPAWLVPVADEEVFARVWPFGLILRSIDFWNERDYLNHLSDKSRTFHFGAHLQGDPAEPQVVVMVIGESSRYDRWSLNGYDRETNPLLSLEENLVSFSDMISAVSATRLSVPIIVSRKPAAQGLQAGFSEKSFLSAYREAGYKTYWISNQMSFGQFDTPTSVFAKEADVTQFLNLGGYTNQSNLDDVLFAPLERALQDAAPKKLIVLHTLGNHWNYSHRHPAEYDHWKPSLYGVVNPAYTDLKNKEALSNSYDNSILYTDWVLSGFIQRLKDSGILSSLMYVSDHGQTLYDGSCNLAFHGHNTQYEFHVPGFVWYSDAYLEKYPEKIRQLRAHQRAPLSTENVFHTLLDMADIRYPDEKLERSILSPRWKPHLRYVDSYGWTNYDNATIKGECREVIDNKTPLSQK